MIPRTSLKNDQGSRSTASANHAAPVFMHGLPMIIARGKVAGTAGNLHIISCIIVNLKYFQP
jgi:hypothetical protein